MLCIYMNSIYQTNIWQYCHILQGTLTDKSLKPTGIKEAWKLFFL